MNSLKSKMPLPLINSSLVMRRETLHQVHSFGTLNTLTHQQELLVRDRNFTDVFILEQDV